MVPHVATFHGAPSGESSVDGLQSHQHGVVSSSFFDPPRTVSSVWAPRRLRTPCPVCFPSAADPKPATGHQLRSESAGQRGSTGPRDLLEGCGDCCQVERQPPSPRASERIWCTTDESSPSQTEGAPTPTPSRRSWFDERGGRKAVAFTHWQSLERERQQSHTTPEGCEQTPELSGPTQQGWLAQRQLLLDASHADASCTTRPRRVSVRMEYTKEHHSAKAKPQTARNPQPPKR